jgi:hypothetical protein
MWTYNSKQIEDKDIPAKALGFLYKITHVSSGKWYIGRKMLSKAKTTQSKGVKVKSKVESGWRDYWSSSQDLLDYVEAEGQDKFTREILLFCDTKACLTLGEEYMLHVTGALFDAKCFNGNIRAKIYRKWFIKTPNFFNELQLVLVSIK